MTPAALLKCSLPIAVLTLAASFAAPLQAEPLPPLAQNPLNVATSLPPMNMLVMGRDRSLYNEAYNDASDLTGSGAPDTGYKPDEIDYYGYFDSYKCYTYGSDRFSPASVTSDKRCSGSWSGDFLNYITTARIDALRKVLYGGKRSTDTNTLTVLERTYIPQDAHGWAKDYRSVALDGYNISHYTPLSLPGNNRSHVFASVSLSTEPGRPLLRVMRNFRSRNSTSVAGRAWEWASIERPVLGARCFDGGNGPQCTDRSSGIDDYTVRVEVCNASRPEANCTAYGTRYKPEGLLQRYGTTGRIEFGLLSGSYLKNISGGVLRKTMGFLNDEIDPNTGRLTSVTGIIRTIDMFRIVDFQSDNTYYPGWSGAWFTDRPMNEAETPDWGNPIGEMVYESARYFAGLEAPTPDFMVSLTDVDGVGMEQVPVRLGGNIRLPVAQWDDPYASRPMCTKASQLIISNPNTSYDTDQVPGSAFSSFSSNDLPGFNAAAQGAAIWAAEGSVSGGRHFIGQSGGSSDGAPTVKTVTSLGNIRGLAPEEPTKLGGYYAASVARYALNTDLRPEAEMIGRQNLQTFSVALASPLPKIEFPTSNGLVTLVPFGKVVQAHNCPASLIVNPAEGQFQPMAQIVDFYIDQWANTHTENANMAINAGRPYARFRINYEDVEQGADHDMDSIVGYEIAVNEHGHVVVQVAPEYVPSESCLRMNFGYVISGVNTLGGAPADGLYLEIRGHPAGNTASYFLNTPPGLLPGACAGGTPHIDCANPLPPVPWTWDTAAKVATPSPPFSPPFSTPAKGASRSFVASSSQAATVLPDPLWYAAKYGAEANADLAPGETPDNYMLVTNAATLEEQLTALFDQIAALSQYAGGLAASGTRTTAGSVAYVPSFDTTDWTGDLVAHSVNPQTGAMSVLPIWEASQRLPAPNARTIVTRIRDGDDYDNVPFTVEGLGGAGGTPPNAASRLGVTGVQLDSYGNIATIVDYLRGNHAEEVRNGGALRNRSRAIGDIITQPVAMGRENNGWGMLPGPDGESYRAFLETKASRTPVVFAGSNDGMLHAFKGMENGGQELFAYVPWAVQSNMGLLLDPSYQHRFFVNGPLWLSDALLNVGGSTSWRTVLLGTTGAGARSVFALDVTNPDAFGPGNVMWEFTDADDPDLGYTLGQARLVRLSEAAGSEWVAVFGNGYYSDNHGAALFVVNAATGELIRKFDANEGHPDLGGTEDEPNGLASPFVAAEPGVVGSQFAYAGDLQGNLWRFDFDGNPDQWTASKIFRAVDAGGTPQPITGGVEGVAHPEGGVMLNFGTGRYFAVGDNAVEEDPQVQSFYGIWDHPLEGQVQRNQLVRQEIVSESQGADGEVYRQLTENPISWQEHRGWYLDLQVRDGDALAERYVTRAQIRLGNVYFPTFRPIGDECEPAGRNFLMILNALTGSPGLNLPPGAPGENACSGSDCGGVSLPGGPPAEPPPIVVVEPGDDGIGQICDAGDENCICPGDDPNCVPGGGTATGLPDNVCGFLVALVPGMEPLPMVRPCGRQSWRQMR